MAVSESRPALAAWETPGATRKRVSPIARSRGGDAVIEEEGGKGAHSDGVQDCSGLEVREDILGGSGQSR